MNVPACTDRGGAAEAVSAVEAILNDWLAEPDLTVLCGDWSAGSVMELQPKGRARLTPARYDGPFAGLRDLVLPGSGHHVHLDLARLCCVTYAIEPSVCFGWRPSFEVRLSSSPARAGGPPAALGLSLSHPYRGAALDRQAVGRYLARMRSHHEKYPAVCHRVVGSDRSAATRSRIDWTTVSGIVDRALTSGHDAMSDLMAAALNGTEGATCMA